MRKQLLRLCVSGKLGCERGPVEDDFPVHTPIDAAGVCAALAYWRGKRFTCSAIAEWVLPRGAQSTWMATFVGSANYSGDSTKKRVLPTIGPALTQCGIANALADPTLELHDGA